MGGLHTFEKIYHLYEFDRRLRGLMLGMWEGVEIRLRTTLSYYLGHAYGGLGYTEPTNFRNAQKHVELMQSLTASPRNPHRQRELFATRHFDKYEGHFPAWAAVEVMSLGTLSKLVINLHGRDRSQIAKTVY